VARRHGIESRYADLRARHALKPFGRGRNYITDLVTEFLPSGTSFDDAGWASRLEPVDHRVLVPNQRQRRPPLLPAPRALSRIQLRAEEAGDGFLSHSPAYI
jgi:hypothetical protein